MFLQPFVLHVDGRPTPCRVAVARSFVQRARGLLWSKPLAAQQALWIARCASIHTVGMGYAIDVVFLDADARVLRVCERVAPWRWRWHRGGRSVLELQAGQAAVLGLRAGCQLADSGAAAARAAMHGSQTTSDIARP